MVILKIDSPEMAFGIRNGFTVGVVYFQTDPYLDLWPGIPATPWCL